VSSTIAPGRPTVPGDAVTPTGAPTSSDNAEAPEGADAFTEGWFSDKEAWPQVALWGTLVSAVAIGAYMISRAAHRNWVGALAGIVPMVVGLYFFFQNVNRLLPPGL
jgi:sortase A